jgi:hypothetical protein
VLVANNDSFVSTHPVTLVQVLANDTYSGAPVLSIVSGPPPGEGKVQIDGQAIKYISQNYEGPTSFVYRLCNAANVCDTATVTRQG